MNGNTKSGAALGEKTIQLLIKINFLIDWDDLNFAAAAAAAAIHHSEMD